MTKTWYPVIDYEKCIECSDCNDKCKHGVYDQDKIPTPVVISPESCIQGCHGCGNVCPTGAIEFVGENTDWVPLNGQDGEECDCGCGCSCNDNKGGCC